MTHARIPRIHSADRRQCCDGLCQQGRYCPQVQPAIEGPYRRPSLLARLIAFFWSNA